MVQNDDLTIQGDRFVVNSEMRPEDGLLRDKSLVDENREVVSSQDPCFTGVHMEIDALDSKDNFMSNGDQGNVDGINGIKSVVRGNHIGITHFESLNNAFALINNSQLRNTDALAGASKSVDRKQEKSLHLERDKTDMQMKRRESDEPVPASVMASSSLQKTDTVNGDGEVSENSGVPRKSSDLSCKEIVSLEKNTVNKGQVSGELTQNEGFSRNALHKGIEKENKSGLNIMSTAIDVQMGTDTMNLVENRSKLVYYGDIVVNERAGQDCNLQLERSRQRCGFVEANSQSSCPKVLTLSGGSTGENTVDHQCSASTEKV